LLQGPGTGSTNQRGNCYERGIVLRPLYRGLAIAGSLGALWSCSGADPASVPQPQNGIALRQSAPHRVPVRLRLRIPAPHRSHNPRLRHQDFIAASTQSIALRVYRASSQHTPATLIETIVANASAANTQSCSTNPDGSRTCSFEFGLPPPAVDIVFATYDEAPAGGAIPSGAKQLAAAELTNQPISVGKKNTISIVLGGIVSSVALQLPDQTSSSPVPTQSIHGTSASQWSVGFEPLDADGNVILTDQFVDANGNAQPVAVTLGAPAGCGSGTIANGSSGTPGTTLSIAAPQSTSIVFAYGATSLAGLIGSTPCTFALTAAAGTATLGSSDFTLSGPKISEFPSTITGPGAMAAGNDGSIWFTSSGAGKAGRFSIQTHAVTTTTGVSATMAIAAGPASAPNLEMWSAGSTGIQDMLSAGGGAAAAPNGTGGFTGPAQGIALGNDGNEWFTDAGSNAVGKITSSGTITEYATPTTGSGPYGMTSGPDGRLWFAEQTKEKIGAISTTATSGSQITEFSVPGFLPTQIAAGNGLLWFIDAQLVDTMNTSGTVTQTYSVTSASFAAIVAGPDNAMYLTDNANNAIARIPFGATSSSQITEYKVPTGNSFLEGIALGADGNIYFAEEGVSQIGELSL